MTNHDDDDYGNAKIKRARQNKNSERAAHVSVDFFAAIARLMLSNVIGMAIRPLLVISKIMLLCHSKGVIKDGPH